MRKIHELNAPCSPMVESYLVFVNPGADNRKFMQKNIRMAMLQQAGFA